MQKPQLLEKEKQSLTALPILKPKLLGSILFYLAEELKDKINNLLMVIDELLDVTIIFVEHFKTPQINIQSFTLYPYCNT